MVVDEWLPSIKRVATCNWWSGSELLLQLAGHLQGRALQEWNVINGSEKTIYEAAVNALYT